MWLGEELREVGDRYGHISDVLRGAALIGAILIGLAYPIWLHTSSTYRSMLSSVGAAACVWLIDVPSMLAPGVLGRSQGRARTST